MLKSTIPLSAHSSYYFGLIFALTIQMDSTSNTLLTLFESLYKNSSKEAVCEISDQPPYYRCTCKELLNHTESLARGFIQDGMTPGQHVALMAKPSINAIITALAVIRSGCVLVPVDLQIDLHSLQHIVKNSSPGLFCIDNENRAKFNIFLQEKVPRIIETEKIDQYFNNTGTLPQLFPEKPVIMFYTSGTTGYPKAVPLTNKNICFELDIVYKAKLLKNTDRLLLPLPMHHVYPFVIGLLTPLYLGVTIILPSAVTGPKLVQAFRDERVSVIIGVPRFYNALYLGVIRKFKEQGKSGLISLLVHLRKRFGISLGSLILHRFHNRFGPHLRILANGGAALDKNLFVGLEAIGWKVVVGYGLTETSPLLTLSAPGKSKPGSAGQTVHGVELRIDTSVAPAGNDKGVGEILARGPNVFKGYYNVKSRDQGLFTDDNWFRTGDLGYFDRDGYLFLIDRLSSVIVTENGENIQPDEVENVYEQHQFIKELGILQFEGKIAAVIAPQSQKIISEGLSIDDGIRIAIEEQSRFLPSYKRITGYALSREEIPRTRLGKIRRHLLIEQYKHLKQIEGERKQASRPFSIDKLTGPDHQLLKNSAAYTVWEILSSHFPDQPINLDSLMRLDLGIDSLAWLELTLEIRDHTGFDIDEKTIATIETVRDLLHLIVDYYERPNIARNDPFLNPESVLEKYQRTAFEPLDTIQKGFRRLLYLLNRAFNKAYFRLRVNGLENLLSAGQCIITPNHVSYIDSFVIAAAIPYSFLLHTVWAAGVEVAFRNKLNSYVSHLAGALPIEHGTSTRSDMALVAAAIDKKKNIIWYPEGRRAPGKSFLPYRPGIGLLLQKRPIPVVPVIIQGTDKAMPIDVILPKPAHVQVTFGRARSVDELLGESSGDEFTDRKKIVSGVRTVMEELRNTVLTKRD